MTYLRNHFRANGQLGYKNSNSTLPHPHPTPQKNKEQKTNKNKTKTKQKQKQKQKQNNPPQEKHQDHLQTFAVRHCTHWSLILLCQ
jgi:hypothetical protein